MNTFFQKTRTYITTHKKTSIFILIVVILIGYFIYKKTTNTAAATTYVLGTVDQGTIVSSVTGSGQVASNRTLDLKPQDSQNVVYVGVTQGQKVSQGQLLVELDTTQNEKAVRNAEASLASAQLSLQKLQEPANQSTLLSDQDAVTQANATLGKDYNSASNDVSNTFLDLPSIMTGLDSVLHGTDASGSAQGQQNEAFYANSAQQFETPTTAGQADQYETTAEQKFQAAKTSYSKTFSDFQKITSSSSTADISNILNETYTTSQLIASAVKSTNDLVQYYQDTLSSFGRTPNTKSTAALSSLSGFTSKITSDASTLLNDQNNLTSDQASIPEKQAQLTQLQAGTDPLDIQSSQLSVTNAQNSLQDAKDNLSNDYVYAPFAGTVADVDVHVGDPASSGTTVVTLIADNQVVVIPLNEVDVSKVSIGDKATMTFDAVDGLTLTGKVTAMDTVGTVTQGVVNYNVTISFDSTDPRVLPGMSSTASIITEVHPDVLTVPSSAVKTSANGSYVLAFVPALTDTTPATGETGVASATTPQEIPVTTGISDDTNTEIDSGLTNGQQIVTRTVVATAIKATTASAPSLLGGATGRTGATAGAARRIGG